ncbi:MAG: ketopantoate reductase family protein [Xanthomonadales bacterium]|nr:ketopantoate reductase family protein [Xanthomonadales bacterium]
MRILVLGAGATGGYFGARLIESGAKVDFLVRPARAAQLARSGLCLRTSSGDLQFGIKALEQLPDSYATDLVILSCKSYDLESATRAIVPAMANGARLLPLLNGLRHLESLDREFGADNVLGGLCHISVNLETDGSIRQIGGTSRLSFGARPGQPEIPQRLVDGLLAMRVETVHSADIVAAMWNKFTLLSALAGITCLMRASIGEIVAVAEGADLARWLYLECAEVARRSGFAPGDDEVAQALRILTSEHSPLKASMLRDVERGKRTEVEHVLGDMLARSHTLGVDAPLLSAACAHLRIHEAALLR